ncbi:MAG TPA: aminoglycoside phosphotransferase family protein, partial [Burkholderiaceae bacterium]|nr:aminoglycoside phosphotransferase family protein [Burkholderiaceae bacterium]
MNPAAASPSLSSAIDHPELWQVAGWQILLPPLAGRRVLCVDSQGWLSAVLAVHCPRLAVACPDEAAAQVARRLALLGLGHVPVRAIQALQPGPGDVSPQALDTLAAALQGPFDGLVVAHPAVLVSPLAGGHLPRQTAAALAALARRVLDDGGFVYLECGNRWAVRSAGNQPDPHVAEAIARPVLSARALRRALRRAGMAEVRTHPYLLSRDRLEEVLPASGYVATKNRELRRERLKELLFGRRGAPWFAHAYGLVAFKQTPQNSVQDLILQRLASATPVPLRPTKVMVFHSMKVILVLEPQPGAGTAPDAGGYVVVISTDEIVTRRREQEAQVLAALATLPPAMAQRVPRLVDRFHVDGHECFVLSRLPGLTLEADVAPLAPVTASAVEFLVGLSLHAATPLPLDGPLFDEVFGGIFSAAAQGVPALQADFAQLRQCLAPRLLGRTLPIGWCHGDFKIENVTYDPATLRVAGVLDWEHASPRGLSYIDLLYLLLYNRVIRQSDWMDAFRALAIERRLTPEEAQLEQRFLSGTGTASDLV